MCFALGSIAKEPILNQDFSNRMINNASSIGEESDYRLKLMNLQVDALGLVFFGPQVSLDFQFANLLAVGPYVRWHYAGVLYQAVVTDWFSESSVVDAGSFSYGAQFKFLIPTGSGQHRPFIGLTAEKSQGEEIFVAEESSGDDRINTFEQNIFGFNVGYRYTSPSAFNLSVGLGIAISQDTENIGFYDSDEDNYDSYSLETRVLPMIQLKLGWELGK